jgi:MFS family permease
MPFASPPEQYHVKGAGPAYPALESRNFRLLWTGQSISLTGTAMQNAAVLWHVSLLADPDQKALALGMVGLARVIPILAIALFAGVVADAFDRRKLMLATQVSMAACAAVLFWLTVRGEATLTSVLVLTGLTAAGAAFDAPARSSLVPTLVPRAHIGSAVSLNTIVFQLASVIGPAAAGVALAWWDVSWVYLLNALSFVAVIGGLLAMRDVPQRQAGERSTVSWNSAVEGVRFAFTHPLVRSSMLLDFIAAFFAAATMMLPLVAQDVLKVGPAAYGWLSAAPSIGAVIASAYMVRNEANIARKGQVLLWAIAAFGAATVLFGLSRSFSVTLVALMLIGATDTVNMVLRNVLRQLATPDRLRGRMSAVNVIFAQGGPQLGEFEAGLVAHTFGLTASIVSGGIATIASTGVIALGSPELRRYGELRTRHALPALRLVTVSQPARARAV